MAYFFLNNFDFFLYNKIISSHADSRDPLKSQKCHAISVAGSQ